MNCPVCGDSPEKAFVKDGYDILECPRCGHRMAEAPDPSRHVEQVYGDDYFTGGGAGYTDYLAEEYLIRAAGRRYARILARHTKPGRILDVGSAAGFVLKGFEDCGWIGTGIEPNAAMASHAQTMLGLRVLIGGLEDLDPAESFDAVSIIQVIGHFQNPRSAIEQAVTSVRGGGYLLIESWNRESLTARLFGRHWHEYSPPSVLHWFSRDGLRCLGESLGLEEVAHGRPLKMLNGGHAKSLIKYKLSTLPLGQPASKVVGWLPNRIPLVYPFDDLCWILFHKPEG